uniref:Dickkopf-related protein 1/2/4 C-terminal subdomain 1 domain-containing protein n=1 Tax=Seriola dumerili TaxID=41447 RepID=A0A3B4UJK3_SERDU
LIIYLRRRRYYVTLTPHIYNRAQRRPSSQDRQVDRQVDRDTDTFNRTKGEWRLAQSPRMHFTPEMSSCVRSGDCAAGLCCVRYLTGKRCQRIPVEGEACLLRGSTKLRRNLGRCDCDAGLSCTAVSRLQRQKINTPKVSQLF